MALQTWPSFPGQILSKREPVFKTDVFQVESGGRLRTALQTQPVYAYTLDLYVRSWATVSSSLLGTTDEVSTLQGYHNACSGSLYPVLYTDPVLNATVTATLPDTLTLEWQASGTYKVQVVLTQELLG